MHLSKPHRTLLPFGGRRLTTMELEWLCCGSTWGRVCDVGRLDADRPARLADTEVPSCRNHSRSRLSSKRALLLRMIGAGAVVSSQETEMAFRSLRRIGAQRGVAHL